MPCLVVIFNMTGEIHNTPADNLTDNSAHISRMNRQGSRNLSCLSFDSRIPDVTIYAKRIFSGFTAEISGSKLHYNSEAPMGVDEELTITLKPVDQLGDQFTSNMTFDAELMNKATAERFVTLTGSSITWKVKAAAGSSLL